ncbi:TspO/MBR family protein [Methylocystis sp. IM3]|uniref:TspO/MBR family protein n=1 Tax=unclassified Methylocystis TaxID=2625913 RepID=UPI000FA7F7A9|nr:MAG: tryptophan-rich sensory protein [Hyphomicrobiales bacterium]
MNAPDKSGVGPFAAAALSAGPILAAALLGNAATLPNIAPWYQSLAKPPLTPPNWVFGPAWTTLYILMGVAFYRILRSDPAAAGRGRAILLFTAQLALNAAWSFAFFAAHSPALGLAVILPLEVLILATIAAFWRLDRAAALCLVPYALWVAFATYLNLGIFVLIP